MTSNDRILIVDDEPINVEILEEILKEYRTASAYDGEEALALLANFKPDIVLMDVMMPGDDGYEVCRKMRKHPASEFAKILFVSGRAFSDERLRGYEAGGDDYIVKPFNHQELLAKINVYLRLKKVEESSRIAELFLGLLSHETNTPLHAIMASLDLVLNQQNMEQNIQNELLEEASNAAKSLKRSIDKLLQWQHLSQIQALSMEDLDYGEVMGLTIDSLSSLAAEKGVTINTEMVYMPRKGNLEQLMQAFRALLVNAIEASHQGALISVKAEQSTKRPGWQLSISDQGPGIPKAYMDRLFEPFQVPDLSHHHKGLGLGLATSKRIAELHMDDLGLQSSPQGTIVMWSISKGPNNA